MLCIDELTQLLEQCTKDKWGSCSQKPAFIHEERVKTYRWRHEKTGLGFLMVLRESGDPLDQDTLRLHINTFRQWGGKNLGLFYILIGGLESGSTQALPYYGTLRTAVLDFPNERLHFGSDSSRFQIMIGALAHVLGIPAGGKAREEVFARQCNMVGPKEWTREQLRTYSDQNLLEWHPLYLSSVFPQLELTLDGFIFHENTFFIIFPQSYPVCSYFIKEIFERYSDRDLVVIYAHSCTSNTHTYAKNNGIRLVQVETTVVDILRSYDIAHEDLSHDILFWNPRIWFSYLCVIAPVQRYRTIGNMIIVDEHYVFLSALSMADLIQVQDQIPNNCVLVLHTQFLVEDSFLKIFSSYVWLYRDEIIRQGYVPIGIERAFLHFNSFSRIHKQVFRWQELFFQREGVFFDRKFGYQVQLYDNIPPDHPWLVLGFLLSMHTHTIPFLLYDQKQRVLVVSKPEKKDTTKKDIGLTHLLALLHRMGVEEKDFGTTYDVQGLIVMSLVDDS